MIDAYGRKIDYLRLSITELCNLRCRYCMPEDGVCKKRHEDMLTEEEMIRAVQAAVSLGITKVRITGGEPLVKKNVLSICEHTAAVEGVREVALTTNATLLSDLAGPLRAAGVSRVNISLDTLDPARYAHITRRDQFGQAMEGLQAALEAGFEKVKINTVLIGGFNEDEIPALAELTRQYPVDVRFIELMPMENGGVFGPEAYLPCEKVLEYLPQARAEEAQAHGEETAHGEGYAHGERSAASEGVARLYRLPDAKGRIGLISPVSSHFCGQCNRIRLTADGRIKPCLHSAEEFSIKGADFLRMKEQFERAILAKPLCHPPLSFENRSLAGRSMNRIGG